jgi:transcriptional antiterminator RfaH
MKWHVIHTKPRQEFRAEENLKNQGFEVFLPTYRIEKLRNGKLSIQIEALFSRYLFIRLDKTTSNWPPIRSTKGVSELLRFGKVEDPVVVPDDLISTLQHRTSHEEPIHTLFESGDAIEIKSGAFIGMNGFYENMIQVPSGEVRAMLLVEFLGRKQRLSVGLNEIKRVA